MELGHDAKELRNLATSVLESDEDLNWATASEPGKEKKEKKENRRTSRKDDDDSGSSVTSEEGRSPRRVEKELARQWFKRRQEQKRVKQRCRTEKEVQAFLLIDRKRPKGKEQSASDKMQSAALQAAAQSSDPLHGLLALHLAESLKGKQKHRHRKSSRQSSRSRSSSTSSCSSDSSLDKAEKGACSSRAELSEGRKEKVQRTDQTCPSVRERHRGRIRSRRQALQDHGLQQAHPLWQTAELEAMPFSGVNDPRVPSQGTTREGSPSGCCVTPGDASGVTRRLLGHRMAPDLSGRSISGKDLRRGSECIAACDCIPSKHARFGKEHRESSKERSWKGRRCRSAEGYAKGKGKNGQKGREKDKDKATSSEA